MFQDSFENGSRGRTNNKWKNENEKHTGTVLGRVGSTAPPGRLTFGKRAAAKNPRRMRCSALLIILQLLI